MPPLPLAAVAPLLVARLLPDVRLLFAVNLVTLVAVVLFAAAVVHLVLRRGYERRVEEQKLAAMGTATARILHQIKNPLQTILLHADLLQNPRIAGEERARREVCDAILGEAQRLTAMLHELSVYASGSRRDLTLIPCPLHSLVDEVARGAARGGALRVDTSAVGEAVAPADPYYLRQVLENLVANAREALEGRDDPRISLAVGTEEGAAVIEVADNGPGIPPERLESVFEPFVSGKAKGMGLGLSICREIVHGHGGRIEVRSRPGHGARFRVLLPLAAPAGETARQTLEGGVP